jgi:hypothetical protein
MRSGGAKLDFRFGVGALNLSSLVMDTVFSPRFSPGFVKKDITFVEFYFVNLYVKGLSLIWKLLFVSFLCAILLFEEIITLLKPKTLEKSRVSVSLALNTRDRT